MLKCIPTNINLHMLLAASIFNIIDFCMISWMYYFQFECNVQFTCNDSYFNVGGSSMVDGEKKAILKFKQTYLYTSNAYN